MSNLSEEEKKAIEMIKDRQKDLLESSKNSFYSSDKKLYKEHAEQINVILNLIKKQQKEIEELQEKNKLVETYKSYMLPENAEFVIMHKKDFLRNFEVIPKDKIREKIEELIKEGDYRTSDNPEGRIHFHKEPTDYKIEVLKELLEESEINENN